MIMRRLLTILAAVSIMSTACVEDKAPYIDAMEEADANNPDISGTGYIQFSDLIITVNEDSEMTAKSSTIDTDNYMVDIYNTSIGESLEGFPMTYLNTQSMTDLEVNAGYYTMKITSYDGAMADVEWEKPEYAETKEFVLANGKTYSMEDVTCYQSNIKVNVSLSADLKELFKCDDDLESGDEKFDVTVSMGSASQSYDYDETRSLYFAPQTDVSTLKVVLKGCYNTGTAAAPVYSNIVWTDEVTDLNEGQSREVKIVVNHYSEGNVNITFEVEDWYEDTMLGVDVTSSTLYEGFSEATIFDPDSQVTNVLAPKITIAGLDNVSDPYSYTVDRDAESYSPIYKATITPNETTTSVSKIELYPNEITTDLDNALGSATLIELWNSTTGVDTSMSNYITVSEGENGVLTVTMKYQGALALSKYVGEQNFTVGVTDDQNRSSYTAILFDIAEDNAASTVDIVWCLGPNGEEYSFDDTHYIYEEDAEEDNIPMVFDITSTTGITSLKVTINSESLYPEFLEEMGLAQTMDLVSPATEKMKLVLGGDPTSEDVEAQEGLGFPVGDEVEGQTYVQLDITSFMALLAGLDDKGLVTEFVITVEDATSSTDRSLKVKEKID